MIINHTNNFQGIMEDWRDAKESFFPSKVDIISLLSIKGQRISKTILGKIFG